MKFFSFLIFSFFLTVIAFPQKNNEEFRATWVITWEYISASSSVEQTKARIRQILDDHKEANMTSVLWQVRQAGTAYYNSSYEPYGSYAGGSYPGFDPFAYAVEEAHKRGLEIHAWFNVFASGSTAPGAPAREHPEWICRDQSGNPMTSSIALSPGMKEVRDYLANVAMEVVRNYDIDGLHYDYIRWNEYSSSALAKQKPGQINEGDLVDGMFTDDDFDEPSFAGRYLYDVEHPYSAGVPQGFSSWPDWWRWSVTQFVKQMHDSVQAVKPWVRISASALGNYNWSSWQGYNYVYQDAALWFNEGYIDQLTPMHYHWLTPSGFYGMLQGNCPSCWGQYIQPGVEAGRLFSAGPGSYRLDEENVWGNHPAIIEEMRKVDWVDGFQFFSYGTWKKYDYWDEAAETFFKKKTKIRDSRVILDTIPDAPSIAVEKIDSLSYKLTISPPASISENQWFAVYRSEDEIIDVDNDEIIDIHFGNSEFTIQEKYTGYQNFNGTYTYAATMLDRYWNESNESNIVSSDAIPSFAPAVIASTPADGDTVDVDALVSFSFSKSMNTENFINHISIEPAVEIASLSWSNENRGLRIIFSNNLDYKTTYTITIDSLAADVNGRLLDGNNDGVEGDSYSITFTTAEQDIYGPVATFVTPSSSNYNFDVEEVITVQFNELIKASDITHNNVILKKGEEPIIKVMQLTNVNGKSILNIKTSQALENSTEYTLILKKEISDLNGNQMDSDQEISFTTSSLGYDEIKLIDDFSTEANWEQPAFSGSTIGIIGADTHLGYETSMYVPASSPMKAVYIQYKWDPAATSHLLRDYLSGGAPREVVFDTSYTLQVYIYGDGTGNRFRFAIDEGSGTSWPNHEVSKWFKIDWIGWKLVEWDLGEPEMTGSWIGNGILDMDSYRIDSFQLTNDAGSSDSGKVYFDNLRIVKKSPVVIVSTEDETVTPQKFALYQNYPNPFNPATIIPFDIDKKGMVHLEIFDLLGRKVHTLINEELSAGHYEFNFDASQLASGKYFYRLRFDGKQSAKMMILLK